MNLYSFSRGLNVVEDYFRDEYLTEQKILSTAEGQEDMLKLIDNESIFSSACFGIYLTWFLTFQF